MTIKECLRKNGIVSDCDVTMHRYGTVEVFFEGENGEDSTGFDVYAPLTRLGEEELNGLYRDFCKTEGIHANTVTEIHLTRVAETQKGLLELW